MSKIENFLKKHKELSKKQDLLEDKQELLSEALVSAGMEDLAEVSDELSTKQKDMRKKLDSQVAQIKEGIDLSQEQSTLEELQDSQRHIQEEIEKALNQLNEMKQKQSSKGKGDSQDQSEQKESSQGQSGKPSDQLGSGQSEEETPEVIDNHDIWHTSPSSQEEQKNTLDAVLSQALEETERTYGKSSVDNHLRGLLEKTLTKPKVNWKNVVKNYLGRCIKYDSSYSRKKPNRKYGFDAQGKVHAFGPKVLWMNDISGSVQEAEYLEFFAEFKGMASEFQESVEVGFFDSTVLKETLKLDANIKKPPQRPGVGGTDFQPVIDFAKTRKPDLLIILTDGAAPVPTKPKFPVLWVICGGRDNPELFGKRVLLELDGSKKNSKVLGSD